MKNTMVEDLFKIMDKAIILSKPISDMTDEEKKTFSDKLEELGLRLYVKKENKFSEADLKDIFTDDYITTMKDNREACDEEKIDITEIMDKDTKTYLNDELIKFLQDYTIKNNKIKLYEAGTIDGLKRIISLYGEPVWIKIKYDDKEIELTGTLTKYKLSYDGLMFVIEYTIELY